MRNICWYITDYAILSTLVSAVSLRAVAGLRHINRSLEASQRASDVRHEVELKKLIDEHRGELEAILNGPPAHICQFETGFHPVHLAGELMVFCSTPRCWAALVLKTKHSVRLDVARAVLEHGFWDEEFDQEGR